MNLSAEIDQVYAIARAFGAGGAFGAAKRRAMTPPPRHRSPL
jgi:hypothetical protein